MVIIQGPVNQSYRFNFIVSKSRLLFGIAQWKYGISDENEGQGAGMPGERLHCTKNTKPSCARIDIRRRGVLPLNGII